jgi:transcriptional regulator GlxA family with amidase domain
VILALDGIVLSDLANPLDVFTRTRLADETAPYRVRVAAPGGAVDAHELTLHTRVRLGALARADTIIVPGRDDPVAPTPPAVLRALRAAAARRTRIASICVGAFVLAEAGLLDGLRATTHWAAADELARRYPNVTVDANVLFVDNGQILTSAGAAAALDLSLHLVRRDYGAAVAADTARTIVMPLERAGGQAQFIKHVDPAPAGSSLEPVLRWIDAHCHEPLTLADIARHAAMSTRTLNRRFHDEAGTTPIAWLTTTRVRRAQQLLEATHDPVDAIAHAVGFNSPSTFRQHFSAAVGTSAAQYRASFRATGRGRDRRVRQRDSSAPFGGFSAATSIP